MTTIEKPKTEKATRPASRWRNRYFALRSFMESCGRPHHRGEEFWSTHPGWPSRDIAETQAEGWVVENPGFAQYLGAFPVEEAA